MILPFFRLRLDDAGLFKDKPPVEHYKQSVADLISWLKANLPDTQEMKETMNHENLSIYPTNYQPYFNL